MADPDIGEGKISAQRNARVALDCVVGCVRITRADQIYFQEAAAENIQVIAGNLFNDSGAADTGFDVNAIGAAGHFAFFDPYVANATGSFAADAHTSKTSPAQAAIENQ